MPPLSRRHAEEFLDPLMSKFGPWDLANYAPKALSFTVVLDAAKSDFASVVLVRQKKPPRGAVVDDRFPGTVPFVTDFALNWGEFRKRASKILAIPPGAIAIGIDTKGTAILIHAIGFSKTERDAVGRDRMIAVAESVAPILAARRNPEEGDEELAEHLISGSSRSAQRTPPEDVTERERREGEHRERQRRKQQRPQQKKGKGAPRGKHTAEWNEIQKSNIPGRDWLMRTGRRDFKRLVVLSTGRFNPDTLPALPADDLVAVRAAIGTIKVYVAPQTSGSRIATVGTWRELKFQEMAQAGVLDTGPYAGQNFIEENLPGQRLSWDDEGDRERMYETLALPLMKLLFPTHVVGAYVQWLWHPVQKELEVEWSYGQMDRWRTANANAFRKTPMSVTPVGEFMRMHLQAVVKKLNLPSSTRLIIDGWALSDNSNQPYKPTVGALLKALAQRPPGLATAKGEPELQRAAEMRSAAREIPERHPALADEVRRHGGKTIIDPLGTAERLLKGDLLAEDFILDDYVDQDPHFMSVRAAQYVPREVDGGIRDALRAKAKTRISMTLTPRFPQWAAGEVFKEWHRRNGVLKRRLMRVWVLLDSRVAELGEIHSERHGALLQAQELQKQRPGIPGEEELKILQTQELQLMGLARAQEDLMDLTEKVRKRLEQLGVEWAGDPLAASTDHAGWAKKWLKDEKWRGEAVQAFKEVGRKPTLERLRDKWDEAKAFWHELDAPARKGGRIPAGLLRKVKIQIGRWQSRASLMRYFERGVLSKKIQGLLRSSYERSGWAAIGEDITQMKLYAVGTWDSLKDVSRFSGGIIAAPAETLRAKLGVPAAHLHDWLEQEALPGFKISVKKLARRKDRWKRRFDKETGETYFVDEETGERVVPPLSGPRVAAAEAAAVAPRPTAGEERKVRRKASKVKTAAAKVGRETQKASRRSIRRRELLARADRARKKWRSLRTRTDQEGKRQAAAARDDLSQLDKEISLAGFLREDEP